VRYANQTFLEQHKPNSPNIKGSSILKGDQYAQKKKVEKARKGVGHPILK